MLFARRIATALILVGAFLSATCLAAEFEIREAGVKLQLPDAWQSKVEEARLPSGQLMQRWVRSPIAVVGGEAMPGMIAIATPVPKDANLALITQQILAREPYKKKLAAETTCIKCMKYKVQLPNGVATTISPDSKSACDVISKDANVRGCSAQSVNLVRVQLEPSWAHLFEMQTEAGTMNVALVHALVRGKLVEVSFFYPPEVAQQMEDEISEIIASMRDR